MIKQERNDKGELVVTINGQIITIPKLITKGLVWNSREHIIYIYGDSILQGGYESGRGQSKVCRGYPNTYGIPTKRTSCNEQSLCYMHDGLFDIFQGEIERALRRVPRDDSRYIYVIPRIGEGDSQMPKKCPKLFDYLMKRLHEEFGYTRPAC
jgi:hypothetical protein